MTCAFRASAVALIAIIFVSGVGSAESPMKLPANKTPADAGAQNDASTSPLRLMPRKSQPLATERSKTAPAANSAASLSRRVVQIKGLTEIDPNSVGSLTAENGGLGTDMWRGTPRRLIERLLPQVPDAIESPTLRHLTRRLLLSAANMPTWENGPDTTNGPSLIATRLRKLQSMGAFKDVQELTALTPKRMTDPILLKIQADDRLFANDFGNACQIVDSARNHLARPYWQQLLVFCQTLSGDREGAALGAGLLAETLETTDAVYFNLIDRLTLGTEEPVLSLPQPTALHLAVMRTAQVAIPSDALSTPHPSVLRAIGISPNARLETRLAAAERAADTGALTAERLAKIYMAEKFEPVELNNSLSLAAADRSPRGRALLFQSAQVESVSMAQAAIYSKAFDLAQEDGRYLATINLYRPLLTKLGTTEDLSWFAAEAARAFYSLDRPLPARGWMEILRLAAEKDDAIKSTLDRLWLINLLSDSTDLEFETGLLKWLDAHQQSSEMQFRSICTAGLRLIEALGYQVPDSAWWKVLESAAEVRRGSGDPVMRRAMLRASEAGRRGETVLLMLLAFGGKAPGIENIDTTATAARALRLVGLEAEARQLVLELAAKEGL